MDTTDLNSKREELKTLKEKVAQMEREIAASEGASQTFPPQGYYLIFHILSGAVLGSIAAASSLLFNIVGSFLVGQYPLQLIRVYLTFPMGEEALTMESGAALAVGCCLYLGTGMLLGIPFHLMLSGSLQKSGFAARFIMTTALAVAVWLINFYGLISWIQPILIGGSWILEQIPVWVAVSTHLVFGWTLLVIDKWGSFEIGSESE